MASTTFSGPVTSTAGFIGDIKVPTYTVANAPPRRMLVLVRLCTFQTALLALQSWPSLMAQTGSVRTQVPQSPQHKESSYE